MESRWQINQGETEMTAKQRKRTRKSRRFRISLQTNLIIITILAGCFFVFSIVPAIASAIVFFNGFNFQQIFSVTGYTTMF